MTWKQMVTGAAVLLLLALLGCAGPGNATRALLARNYTHMTNAQLKTYFRQLNDQIATENRAASGGGFSFGSAPAPKTPPPPRVEKLRVRRNRVWNELSKRGLMP